MNCKVNDKIHYLKGVMWDMLIDQYMPDVWRHNLHEVEKILQEIEIIINKLDKINIFEFAKALLKQFETITEEEKVDFFEEVFLENGDK